MAPYRHRKRSIAWLGLWAILLLSAAPTVSRVLAAADAMPDGCAQHGAHMHPAARHPMLLDDCGYCSLMCDSPGLAGAAVLWLPMSAIMPAPRRAHVALALEVAAHRPKARGPPIA
ncbi:DUF2946 domain-containing protein [Dyella sp.]|uniref:DUF2946 domain-containing protein n=1 Tax=Dyella sp. TaxID=1869338 RepID=UPI002ED3E7CC